MTSKTALVTGASSGIGWEFAKVLAKQGVNLILVARSQDKLEKLASELKAQVKVEVMATDLSDLHSVETLCDNIEAKGFRIEYLINNAGFGDFGMFAQTEWKKTLEMLQLNIVALTYLTRRFLPAMIERRSGRVLNVASTAAFQPGPVMAVYFATKAYVLSLSEALANELEDTGVTVTTLCPGPTTSGFQEAAKIKLSPLVKDRKLPSSAEVAEFGYKSMMSGKTVAIHGLTNFALTQVVRFFPRNVVTKIVRRVQGPT